MELFPSIIGPYTNILPYDGTVNYCGNIFNESDADDYFHSLYEDIMWCNDEAIIFGKKFRTKRKVAWYGDHPFQYTYSHITKIASPWLPILRDIKNQVEVVSGLSYNSCLLNLYHNGSEAMSWHSDAEKDLKNDGAIASLSLGAERKFSFKHKVSKEKVDIFLPHGSLLVMKGCTQTHWLHQLPASKKVTTPRINLTFRSIEDRNYASGSILN